MTPDGEEEKWSKAAKIVFGSQLCAVKCVLVGEKGRIPQSPWFSFIQTHSSIEYTHNADHRSLDECENC